MINFLQPHSYWIPILMAGSLIACLTAPLGCLILWQRKSFLGEALAHAALAGVALSFIFKLPPVVGVMAISMGVTWLLKNSSQEQSLPRDAKLAMIAQGGLAVGLILLSTLKGQRIDINTYLFGDLLMVSTLDIAVCAALVAGLGVFLVWRFQSILAFIIHKDLAQIEGLASRNMSLQLMAAITFTIAILLPIIGVLLLTSLMVIPAATARHCSKTPQGMMIKAVAFSNISMLGGLVISFIFNLPTSPTMVIVSLGAFLLILGIKRIKKC